MADPEKEQMKSDGQTLGWWALGGGGVEKFFQYGQSKSLGPPLKVVHGTGRKRNTSACFSPA